jgi:hypothetical protein
MNEDDKLQFVPTWGEIATVLFFAVVIFILWGVL